MDGYTYVIMYIHLPYVTCMSYVLVICAFVLGAGAVLMTWGKKLLLSPSVLTMWLQRYFPDHSHQNSLFLGRVGSLKMFAVLDLHLFSCSPVPLCPLGSPVSPSFTILLTLLCAGVWGGWGW